MKEGTKIADHLNVFNTLICQLNSVDVKPNDEDKAVALLYQVHLLGYGISDWAI
jgi:hypothetical protein